MTPKQCAINLINKYKQLSEKCNCLEYSCICFYMGEYKAKQCAMIAIDFAIKYNTLDLEYLNKVKQEIEKYDY